MGQEIENFVTYSLRYQLLLAQRVAGICNMKVYVFDSRDFFDSPDDTKVEVIDNVRTVSKEGKRAVLSVAVKESFGANEELFLKFVDDNVVQKDDIGLYVISPVIPEKQGETKKESEEEVDLKDISEAIEKIESVL
jgi:hypothetical protein